MKLVICTKNQCRNKQGIHLNNSDLWYLNDAFNSAERDNFETIYLHYKTIGTANYVIPYDVLTRIVELQANSYHSDIGFLTVKFIHPATPDKSPNLKLELEK